MTNDIRFLTGIKDPHLKFDHPATSIEHGLKVIHPVQSYPMKCPHCGQLMKRNDFRRKPVVVKIFSVAGTPTVLSIKNNNICAQRLHSVRKLSPGLLR